MPDEPKNPPGRPPGKTFWGEPCATDRISAGESFFVAWKDIEFKKKIKRLLDERKSETT